MFLRILLLLLCFSSCVQGQNDVAHSSNSFDIQALQSLLDILEDCWSHKAVVVVFPHPLTDALLIDLTQQVNNRALFLDMSTLTDLGHVAHLAKERMVTHVLLAEIDHLAQTVKDNYQDVLSTSNKITWVLPMDIKDNLYLESTRLDSLQLFFSNKDQSALNVQEIFGYKGKEMSWNPVGSKWKNSSCVCSRIGGKIERRQPILKGKVLHFASVTPNFRDVEDVLEMTDDVAFYSPSLIMRHHLTELAQQTQLILKETKLNNQLTASRGAFWTNLLDLLRQNNSIDVIAESYAYTAERLEFLDFTRAACYDGLFFITRIRNQDKLNISNFLTLFSPRLWLAICTSVLIIGIYLAIFDFSLPSPNSLTVLTLKSVIPSFFYWWCSLLLVLLQRGSFAISSNITQEFKSSKARFFRQLLLFKASLLFLIIFSLLASNLTTVLTTNPDHQPFFTELSDLLAPKVKIRVIHRHALSYFKDSRKPSPWNDIYSHKIEDLNQSVLLMSAAAAKEFLSSNDEGVIFDFLTIELAAALKSIETERHEQKAKIFGSTMPVRKNSEITELLNYSIMKLAEGGMAKRFKKKWLPPKNIQANNGQVSASSISLQNASFLFFALALGFLSAFCLVIVEIAFHSLNRCRWQKNRNRIESIEG